ncbi:hypothetical protein [Labrenzia sp. VG12]|uniref:hypothetical protein n=1 Tax=Labrenzia sp. VG12 TaxID=2021862 RepID=UPI0012FD2EFC|nr:hypothetical protein [Labrenzia sp. VG12]
MTILLQLLFGYWLIAMFLAGRFLDRLFWLFPLALGGGVLRIIINAQKEIGSRNWAGDGPGYFDDSIWPAKALTHAAILLGIGLIGRYFRKRALRKKLAAESTTDAR